jgi:hypothetical protein
MNCFLARRQYFVNTYIFLIFLELEKDNDAIIAAVVPALIIVILIAVGIVIWLRYFHKKRMVFMQREFEDAIASGSHGGTLTNPYDYQHP